MLIPGEFESFKAQAVSVDRKYPDDVEAMEAYGHKKKSRAEVHEMMLEVDVDGSQQIEYDELCR